MLGGKSELDQYVCVSCKKKVAVTHENRIFCAHCARNTVAPVPMCCSEEVSIKTGTCLHCGISNFYPLKKDGTSKVTTPELVTHQQLRTPPTGPMTIAAIVFPILHYFGGLSFSVSAIFFMGVSILGFLISFLERVGGDSELVILGKRYQEVYESRGLFEEGGEEWNLLSLRINALQARRQELILQEREAKIATNEPLYKRRRRANDVAHAADLFLGQKNPPLVTKDQQELGRASDAPPPTPTEVIGLNPPQEVVISLHQRAE